MKILIQAAQIIDRGSPFHKKKINVLVQDGRITQIGDKNWSADKVIKAEGMILSPGWFDLGTFSGDPGLEQKEDMDSLTRAAASGGFTEIAALPNTVPSVQTKNAVSYVVKGNGSRLVQVHPLASVTRDNKGEELTEIIDLHTSGAIGFTDGLKTLWHTDIFLKTLQYLQKFNGLLIDHPEDYWLNLFGQMHEGVNSTLLGLKGMPGIAEEISVNRGLELLRYAGGRLHLTRLSTAKSIDYVRSAKKKGLQVTCDCTTYQPLLDDSLLSDFDTNYKLNPPLREKSDQDALLKGLKDGTIDVLVSGHMPHDEESKALEFDLAEFGMINLQTCASQLSQLLKPLGAEALIEKVTNGPRALLDLPQPRIDSGEDANLTLFDPGAKWTFDHTSNQSKSKNSPWLNKTLTGKAVAVFNKERYHINE